MEFSPVNLRCHCMACGVALPLLITTSEERLGNRKSVPVYSLLLLEPTRNSPAPSHPRHGLKILQRLAEVNRGRKEAVFGHEGGFVT